MKRTMVVLVLFAGCNDDAKDKAGMLPIPKPTVSESPAPSGSAAPSASAASPR